MPSLPILIREAKEPFDSGRPYLKPSTKEEKKKKEKQKSESAKAERRKKSQRRKRYAKRRAVKVLRRTWFLVKWVPKIIKILPKRYFKSNEGLFVNTPAK